jgi:chromosome segregation ATPase
MRRVSFLLLAFSVVPTAAFAQSITPDSHTLQEMLSEIRQLRKDLQTTSIASQRAQILLYRLQSQQAAVARAQQRTDEIRSRLADAQDRVRHFTSEVERAESSLNESQSPVERQQVEGMLTAAKRELESQKVSEQDWETKEAEAVQSLRSEESKLSGLEEQLDRLDNDLTKGSR